MQRNCYLVIKKIKNRKNSTLYKVKVRKVVIKNRNTSNIDRMYS